MWLSEQTTVKHTGECAHANIGQITISGSKPAVALDREYRNAYIISPQGLDWRPDLNQQVLALQSDEGETFLLGVPIAPSTLNNGEIRLSAGSGWLHLSRDGSISAEGDWHITGDVYITGRLFLNGIQVVAKSDAESASWT